MQRSYFGFNKPICNRRHEVRNMGITLTIEIYDEEDAETIVAALRKINELTEWLEDE